MILSGVASRTYNQPLRRYMIDYSRFGLSLTRLEQQNRNYRQGNPLLSDLTREAIAESVIWRFKACYDCLWKVLKRYLMEELGIADPPNSPKPILRLAHENHLFAVPLEQWFRYADARVGTSHDCDGARARACLGLMPGFIDDAAGLYQTMTDAPWE